MTDRTPSADLIRRHLRVLEALVASYTRHIASGAGPLGYERGLHVVTVEWEITRRAGRLPVDAAPIVDALRGLAAPEIDALERRVGRLCARLWRAWGRLTKRMPRHPDVLARLRALLRAVKHGLRRLLGRAPRLLTAA